MYRLVKFIFLIDQLLPITLFPFPFKKNYMRCIYCTLFVQTEIIVGLRITTDQKIHLFIWTYNAYITSDLQTNYNLISIKITINLTLIANK